jgi:hypothetical protein
MASRAVAMAREAPEDPSLGLADPGLLEGPVAPRPVPSPDEALHAGEEQLRMLQARNPQVG